MGLVDNERLFVTAGEVARNFGRWQDEAARMPVVVTHHGRQRVVLVSAETFDEMTAESTDPYQARLAAVLGHSAEGFFAMDGAMVLAAANQAFEDFTGMAAAQMIGRPYAEVFPTAAQSIAGEHFRRVLRTGEPCQFELHSTVRTGAILDVRAFPYATASGCSTSTARKSGPLPPGCAGPGRSRPRLWPPTMGRWRSSMYAAGSWPPRRPSSG